MSDTSETEYDLVVIGGGINGTGIARDAAGRGLKVLLAEQGDLAGATSSASTKLIHGGLRYLEFGEFGLVRHALQEREILLNLAPHIISPLEFILPHEKGLRPRWMIRLGLFFYDHLSRRDRLPSSKALNLKGGPLNDQYSKGFSYADCWVDDARLVVLNAIDAAERGATILTHTKCTGLVPEENGKSWTVYLKGRDPVSAKMVVNAAGPWVREVLESSKLTDDSVPGIRLVKGSHIIVPRLFEGDRAYILQQPDRRIVFSIPYEHDFTLIGTTEVEHTIAPAHPEIEQQEIEYLCTAVNRSFAKQITPQDIIWTYSGVRPLLDDGDESATSATRDYRLVLDNSYGATLLSVFGGKITTYRHLAEEAVDLLHGKKHWTADHKLPGGDINAPDFETFAERQISRYSGFPAALINRYAHAYGTRMEQIIRNATTPEGLGRDFGGGLYEAEVRYLIDHEWAQSTGDILWRRSKLGLHVDADTVQNLETALPELLKERQAA